MSSQAVSVNQARQNFELRDRNHGLTNRVSEATEISERGPGMQQTAERPLLKLLVCGYSFFISGLNDGCLGPLMPYILKDFEAGTGKVAFMYLCTFLGWVLALPLNPILPKKVPLGITLLAGAVLQFIGNLMRLWGPYPLFSITFFIVALGMALQDSHSNTFVSSVSVAHRWLGFIHASYAAGLVIGPLISTSLASDSGWIGSVRSWRATYYVLVGIAFINVIGVLIGFRDMLRPVCSAANPDESPGYRAAFLEVKQSLQSKSLWLLSLSFFFQLGAMMTASGWVVEYLVTVRNGDISKMGFVQTGFNAGSLLGRVLLVEPIHRFGERRSITISLVVVLALQLVFWLLPNIPGSATAFGLMGFFAGPFIPVGIGIASKLFPRKTRSAALGLIFVLAQAGGAFSPSLTGVIAQEAGVVVLQPIMTGLIASSLLIWFFIPPTSSIDEGSGQ